jgi:transaldolase
MTNQNLSALSAAGVSIWLDDLSRDRLTSGSLAEMVKNDCVTGVTTNPSIFAAAIADGSSYQDQLGEVRSLPIAEVIQHLCAQDVQNACDVFAATFKNTDGDDGWVSIEVAPTLAHDAQATVAQAQQLKDLVGKDNVFVKIPATHEGVEAIEEAIARGISVNATLIFSVARYEEVTLAYLRGLARAAKNGRDISRIRSVASVFISRVDTEVDRRLAELGHPELQGEAAVANARLVYEKACEVFSGQRYEELASQGARAQRVLWASTGTKNPHYSDTRYVTELVAPHTINTMPEKTLRAFADHGHVGTLFGDKEQAEAVFGTLASAGIDLADVFSVLESEGVQKFIDAWHALETNLKTAISTLDK